MPTRQPSIRRFAILSVSLLALASMTACGTLTGIPAHGGGKRFATEQRLVSASIRAALKDIDVTPLKGKRAALIFDLVADEGGGSFNGGIVGGTAAALAGGGQNVQGDFGLGQSAAENAIKNNFLKFDEAKKLQALKEQELKGQCTGNCKAEITRLEAVDKQRNEQLAQCEGSTSAGCQQAFKEVRLAAVDYVRRDEAWALAGQDVLRERTETLKLAQGTTDGKLQGAVQGYWDALKDSAIALKGVGQTLYAAAIGDQQAKEKIKTGAGAAADYVSEPANWPYLLGAMTPQQREQLALAYESGNGEQIGRLMAQQIADMPIGGGGMGSIKKIDDVIAGASRGVNLAHVEVDVAKATKGSPEYNMLNAPPPNSQVKLSNGTEFKTNPSGYVEEITYTPSLNQGVRDARQTAAGKEGLSTDVGGHVQACSLGGTCDRFNLFPQDGNFNNSAYKRWENEIKGALNNGDQVGAITVRFSRTDPASARPDSLVIDYSINGAKMRKSFKNEAGQ